jgi:hypothetical protein
MDLAGQRSQLAIGDNILCPQAVPEGNYAYQSLEGVRWRRTKFKVEELRVLTEISNDSRLEAITWHYHVSRFSERALCDFAMVAGLCKVALANCPKKLYSEKPTKVI